MSKPAKETRPCRTIKLAPSSTASSGTSATASTSSSSTSLYAADFVGHQIAPPRPEDRSGQKQMLAFFHSVFPDLQLVFEDEIVESSKLAGRGYDAVREHPGVAAWYARG